MTTQPVLYVNGRFVPPDALSLSPLDRGFTIADGLFETMAVRGDRVFRLADHLARLRRGTAALDIPLPSDDELAAILQETLRRNALAESAARLTVTRGVDLGRGLALPAEPHPTIVVRVSSRALQAVDKAGLRLVVSSIRRDEASPLSSVKSLAYTAHLVARLEAQRAEADDALMRNIAGNLACATSSSLFLVVDGVLVTPPLTDGALPSISRKVISELASKEGIETIERSMSVQDLRYASEVIITNVVTGPRAVVAVDGQPVGGGHSGSLARRLASLYWQAVASETK